MEVGLLKKGIFTLWVSKYSLATVGQNKYSFSHANWSIGARYGYRFVLAMLAFIIRVNPSTEISVFEIIGLLVWFNSYRYRICCWYAKIDIFVSDDKTRKKNRVCNVSLWLYSGHSNYFTELMFWNGLIITAVPSLIALYKIEVLLIWTLLLLGLFYASKVMYTTLVYLTGAVPSEHYSAQKRPEYKQYQQTTRMFFPGKPKN